MGACLKQQHKAGRARQGEKRQQQQIRKKKKKNKNFLTGFAIHPKPITNHKKMKTPTNCCVFFPLFSTLYADVSTETLVGFVLSGTFFFHSNFSSCFRYTERKRGRRVGRGREGAQDALWGGVLPRICVVASFCRY
ncbi:hypothetical protein Dimus_021451 [Dionaea muscipula]